MKRKPFKIHGDNGFVEILGYPVNLGTRGIRWFVHKDDDPNRGMRFRKKEYKPWVITEYNTGLQLCRARTMGLAILEGLDKVNSEYNNGKDMMEVVQKSLASKGRANPDENQLFELALTEWEIAR